MWRVAHSSHSQVSQVLVKTAGAKSVSRAQKPSIGCATEVKCEDKMAAVGVWGAFDCHLGGGGG
jgi:hypothetical protein